MALAPGSRFRGEAAVLTGASGGIGAAIAPALSGAGFRLLLTGRDGAALERVADPIRRAGGEARTFVLDLLEPGAPERLRAEAIRALGVPYLLVNDAGSLRVERLERRPPEEIARELALDLAVPIALTRAFLPVLLQRGRGQILNVGSAVVDLPLPRLAVYAAAKAGLRAFSVALDRETRRRGVRSTVLEPIFVRTGLGRTGGAAPAPIDRMARRHPRMVLEPEVVARYALRALHRPRPIVRVPAAWSLGRPILGVLGPIADRLLELPPPRPGTSDGEDGRLGAGPPG